MTKQRRVAVSSPQTRLVIARRRSGARVDPPHLAGPDMERARRVHREQLRRAMAAVAGLAGLIIGLPLVLAAFPELDAVRLFGVPVSWLAVAVLPYAVLVLLAGWQLRRAEDAEDG
ncbi:hypothetical protein I4I73_26770 [Pseudonocardia sp. KRD-184]|uniref:Solute:sodium symporter small subunit n=1 Tax=Pseudonocardia oceani TaxID=2792013 RepID=A0ABS6UHX2_9PSEU|nr:hypothetical protein [Pseudonocardia oceani]MBW0091602.1 hypothetical protein [Pseudonocardia oceani]MBW0099598.1 hypothetical protein [Pseudonocardia oceani]MBW0112229.1 hypothetical protein [Pseudonocardia oceani]MBW0124317.1 hypothetical protein [Pseudonocardia oceani]MBW0131429.1 hypothetical protein [Pseudonocardia oceani]